MKTQKEWLECLWTVKTSRLPRICLLLLVGLTFLPAKNPFEGPLLSPPVNNKTLEEYWNETDLDASELEVQLRTDNCSRSQRHFLACVNAVSSIAEKMGFVFLQDGNIRRMTAEDMDLRLTEREDLKRWAELNKEPEQFRKFNFIAIWDRLRNSLPETDKINAYVAAGINGYLSIAEDPHSYIMPLQYFEEVASRSESKAFQLGFVARRVHGGALVRKVFSNSPASRGGLKKGDRILRLNGLEVSRLHPSIYSDLIRGLVGERLLVELERNENGKKTNHFVELRREEFQMTSVESRMLPGDHGIGILTIHKFAHETCLQARVQLIGLMEQSVRGLLLDLRDNPGGQVDEAACVLNLFLAKDTLLFETRYLDATRTGELYVADRNQIYDGPMAVLINGGSASASEIVAGSIKDHARGILVGERSFGKGSFQDGGLWRRQSQIAFFQTQGFYYFPSGWTPQLVGLQPDIPVNTVSSDSFREEDLYLVPLRPRDLWNGPQTLAWLHQARCGNRPLSLVSLDDPQIEKAEEWIQCNAETLSRNGGI